MVIADNKSLDILLVEDETIAMMVHSQMLEMMGFHPDKAENGRTALSLALNHHYDLILMDIGLPDTDGIQVTAKIRRQENECCQKRSCIIALTAYPSTEVSDKCLVAGMDEVANKPLKAEQLQQLITQFCGATY